MQQPSASSSSAPATGDPYAALALLQQQYAAMQQQMQQQALQQQQQFAHMQQNAQAAASAAAAAASVVAPPRLPKIGLPPKFKGTMGGAVDTWRTGMVQQFAYYGIADEASKLRMAAGNLEGDALLWYNSILANDLPGSWDEFMERLLKRFRPVAAVLIARQSLAKLRQGSYPVNHYAHRFQTSLTAIHDMSAADQVFQFANGLTPVLMSYVLEKQPTTLAEAIQWAASKEATVGFAGRAGGSGPPHHRAGAGAPASESVPMDLNHLALGEEEEDSAPRFPEEPASSSRTEAMLLAKLEAMELRITALNSKPPSSNPGYKNGDRIPGLKREDIERLRKEGRCFRCKQKGHMKGDSVCTASQKQGN